MGEEMGTRIRKARQKSGHTLAQVSEGTSLSKGFLSQVERGLTEPSISSLKKIARHLGTNVIDLVADDVAHQTYPSSMPQTEGVPNNHRGHQPLKSTYREDIQVVRRGRRKSLSFPGSPLSYDLLTPDLNRRIEVLYLRAKPGASSGDELIVDPPGEKFGLVLSGCVEVTVGNVSYELRQGDAIYFPCHFPHSWRVCENEPIRLIWVMSPPSF